ncbi:hypothetical protein ES703_04093 [subsurface metagenome]|jgi:hypothetical protein
MDIHEFVKNAREAYTKKIKLLIDRKEYHKAYMDMANLVDIIDMRKEEMYAYIHMAPSFSVSARTLRDKLLGGNPLEIEESVKEFEAYSAQTELPKSD